ncbi:MAG: hypothetical protein GX066_01780 [Clostridiaceae bacterium]|nr:hypothetical protein [Clostridiaceae bacterium]
MAIRGYILKSRKTKELIKFLSPHNIPVLCHEDLDEVAAHSLIDKKVKAVINCCKSISGRYPSKGAKLLLENEIMLIDSAGEEFFQWVNDGDFIEIKNSSIYVNGNRCIFPFCIMTTEKVEKLLSDSYDNFTVELEKFIDNTLEYAGKEKDIILKKPDLSFIESRLEGKHVLIVVRGCNYKQDLQAIKGYINDFKPVLIGVDGGADALLEFGLIPDIIVGDMDSVSDIALKKCKEVIVHAFPDGKAPGLARVERLGLKAKIFPFPGTSEDVAMIIAYEKKADMIVAVGTHSNMIDFLEKGRKGMASTMLTRLKIGSKLVDAKGVSKLYPQKLRLSYCIPILLSALIPIIAVMKIYIPIEVLINLFQIKMKIR